MKLLLTIITTITLGMALTSRAEDPKPYPLTNCVVSGEKLDAMGKPVTLVYEGQEMKFCCKYCVEKFKADPAKYIKKVSAEEKS